MSERRDLLVQWIARARSSQFAHYQRAAELIRGHYWLGFPIVALTALVGGIGVSGSDLSEGRLGLAWGGAALLSTMLAALQTFLRSSERAGEHRSAGARYGAVRRHMEQLVADWDQRQATDEDVAVVRSRLDTLALEVPNVSEATWERSKKRAAKE